MKRVYIKFNEFNNNDHMNIEGDYIFRDGDYIYVYNGDYISAIVRHELINLICISEKKN
jgi:hypothetical protein